MYLFSIMLWSDCPQVQCIEPYLAQQADELTLEPTEIINVIRKTNEGENNGEEHTAHPNYLLGECIS